MGARGFGLGDLDLAVVDGHDAVHLPRMLSRLRGEIQRKDPQGVFARGCLRGSCGPGGRGVAYLRHADAAARPQYSLYVGAFGVGGRLEGPGVLCVIDDAAPPCAAVYAGTFANDSLAAGTLSAPGEAYAGEFRAFGYHGYGAVAFDGYRSAGAATYRPLYRPWDLAWTAGEDARRVRYGGEFRHAHFVGHGRLDVATASGAWVEHGAFSAAGMLTPVGAVDFSPARLGDATDDDDDDAAQRLLLALQGTDAAADDADWLGGDRPRPPRDAWGLYASRPLRRILGADHLPWSWVGETGRNARCGTVRFRDGSEREFGGRDTSACAAATDALAAKTRAARAAATARRVARAAGAAARAAVRAVRDERCWRRRRSRCMLCEHFDDAAAYSRARFVQSARDAGQVTSAVSQKILVSAVLTLGATFYLRRRRVPTF
eukprot:CAMPEP_0119296018 /NCGR_PEP_ID=MMETSP1329-20130426/50351_1 /TAXON_ID=114041 /ORGANISM="Genus nov. species nov., Strain RCC1024" /LENGTH=431 /DNA_ID=CAMNT_0007296947 /DNA_START=245 /DNA_END=1540 /DNA_ORIENTATION=-